MDGNSHSKVFCSWALISMLIVSLANNRAPLFLSQLPQTLLITYMHTLCFWRRRLPQRSGIFLSYLDESSAFFLLFCCSVTDSLAPIQWVQRPSCPQTAHTSWPWIGQKHSSRVTQSPRKGLRGFVHI